MFFLSLFILFLLIFLYGYARKRVKLSDEMNTKPYFARLLLPVSQLLVQILPKSFFGSEKILHQKYAELYGEKNCSKHVYRFRLMNAASFYAIGLIFTILLMMNALEDQCCVGEITHVVRPLWDSKVESYPVKAVLKYKGERFEKNIRLNVRQRLLSEEEVEMAFDLTKGVIGQQILGGNTDLKHVYKDLNLYTYDSNTGVNIKWTSNQPEWIDERGHVYIDNINQPKEVVLSAVLELQNSSETYDEVITVLPYTEAATITEIVDIKIAQLIKGINLSQGVDDLQLPGSFEGIQIKWVKNEKRISQYLMAVLLIAAVILHIGKYNKVNKALKIKRLLIEKEFPDFINKLVLLLNAGLIVQSALEKMVIDYNKYALDQKRKPLYEELSHAIDNAKESNASFVSELRSFAVRCRVREIMRFVSIVNENINMGSALVDKLQSEADLTWQNRKYKAEALGRLAETKLTFPLLIFLLVLIIVIITPAFMEM